VRATSPGREGVGLPGSSFGSRRGSAAQGGSGGAFGRPCSGGDLLREPPARPGAAASAVASSEASAQARQQTHFQSGNRQDITVLGRSRGQVLVVEPQESCRFREEPAARASVKALERRAPDLSEIERRKRRREEGGRPSSRRAGKRSGEARKTHESIGPRLLRLAWVRISAGSKALELRGIVTSWSSEQDDAMSETAGGHRR
jgi:hypothetical protein